MSTLAYRFKARLGAALRFGRSALGFMAAAIILLSAAPDSAGAQEVYRLGEGDLVKITVFQRPDLSVEARLGTGGRAYIPMVGKMALGGKTPGQAEEEIAEELGRTGAQSRAQVDVQVAEFGSQKVSVFGFVVKPGSYVLDRPTRLSELLATTGGITPDGSDDVILLRGSGDKVQQTIINVRDIIQAGARGADVYVKGGDIVTIPRAPRVYVYGAVNRPGAYKLEKGMTALEMISLAGGLNQTGSDNRLEVVRHDGNGNAKASKIGLQDPLAADDVLVVKESIF